MLTASVIIPTFHRSESLARCLRALSLEIQEGGIPAEIVVVDDGTTGDDAKRIAEQVISSEIESASLERHEANRGVSAARNTGAERAKGDVLIFLDDDLIPSPSFIRDHVAVHHAHSDVLIACGHLFTRVHSVYGRFWARCYDHVFCKPGRGRDIYPIDMLSSGNFSIKRSVLAQLQPLFDPNLPSREDFDLFLRATDAGLTVYKTEQAAAEIIPRSSFSEFYKQKRWYAQGEAHLRDKHGETRIMAAQAGRRTPFTFEMRVLSLLVRLRRWFETWTETPKPKGSASS